MPNVSRLFPTLIVTVSLLFSAPFPASVRAATCPGMQNQITNGSWGLAEVSGQIADGCNLDDRLIPASIIKVATVLAAMRILGPDFRFATEFYSDAAGNLYIKGLGDPSLVSEEVALIAAQLKELGLNQVKTLFVDDSAFALEGPVPGQTTTGNPYDAPVAALAVNFNTLAFFKDKAGRVSSGEKQTPMLPLTRDLARKGKPGFFARVNVCMGGEDFTECSLRYAAELFRAFLQKEGIKVSELGGRGKAPEQAKLLLRHESSKNLEAVSTDLMRSSSNFIANLIFLQAGAKKYGFPATWTKSRRMMQEELDAVLGPGAAIHVVEGSGLSRDTTVNARTMLALLQQFRPYQGVMKEKNGVLRKSGTMTGIYNLAGYLPDGRAYVIMLNQPQNTRDAVLTRLLGEREAGKN